jgi:hypothetical protein
VVRSLLRITAAPGATISLVASRCAHDPQCGSHEVKRRANSRGDLRSAAGIDAGRRGIQSHGVRVLRGDEAHPPGQRRLKERLSAVASAGGYALEQLQLGVPVVELVISRAPGIPSLEGAKPPLLRQLQVVVGGFVEAPLRPQKIAHHAIDGHAIP